MNVRCYNAIVHRRQSRLRWNRLAAAWRAAWLPMALVLALVAGPRFAAADVTSADHPVLKRAFDEHPAADTDGDGLLSYAEYRTLIAPQDAQKQPGGEPLATVLANGDMVICDFEDNNLGRLKETGWKIEGAAFNRNLDAGTRVMKRRVGAYAGQFVLSSYIVSDADVGEILSPEFDVELDYVAAVISGGDHPHRVCVNLVVDDQVVRTVTGENNDLLETVAFNVSEFKGRKARVQIVDASGTIWGHINVDRIYQTGRADAKRVISQPADDYGKAIGSVRTLDGNYRRAPLALGSGGLTVGKQVVPLDSLLLVVCEREPVESAVGSSLRLVSGEVWQAKITGLAGQQVSIESPQFGKRDVPLAEIASLEFTAGAVGPGEPGTLYRTKGESIPGKLTWIRDQDIAIDCPLGVVPIPRQAVRRFVVAAVNARATGTDDEIGLTDGSLFRGRLGLENEKLVLTHPTLGALSFAWDAIRYVQRTPSGASWLDRMEAASLEQVGPVLPPPPPGVVEADREGYLRAVRMVPHTVARYRLPEGIEKLEFRGQLAPIAGSRGDVTVRIRTGDRAVWENKMAAATQPISVSAALPGATELTIEVDYIDGLAFPCGVNWFDAYVLASE